MNKHTFNGSEKKRIRTVILAAALTALIVGLFIGVSTTLASSTKQFKPDESMTIICDGRGFNIERLSRTHLSLLCVEGRQAGDPGEIPDPNPSPPEPTPTPSVPSAPGDPADPISNSALMFYDGFEAGIIPYQAPGYTWKPVRWESSEIINSPTRLGNAAVKLSISYSDPWTAPASELRLDRPHEVNHFDVGNEFWYAFSIYLPEDFQANDQTEIFNQFHNIPDTHLGEEWNLNPPFALYVSDMEWRVIVRGDAAPVTKKGDYDVVKAWSLGTVKPGEWTDFVYNIKWSYMNDGFTKVWRDGQLVVDYKGANTFNDQEGPFWKLGIYEWYWNTGPTKILSRTAYYDEVRVGNANATYEMMVPENNVRP